MCAKRLERHHKEAVVKDLQKGNRTYKQLSQKHSISVSTIHRIAEAEGLTTKRTRTSATEIPEETYDGGRRRATLDRIMKSIDDQVARGGQRQNSFLTSVGQQKR